MPSSGISSRTGPTSTWVSRAVDSCVDAANSRSDSISSPQYSKRTGRRATPGKTSSTPPRTANSPRCSTTSARRYPRSTSCSASLSGGRSRPGTSSIGGTAPSVGMSPCIAASAGATRTVAPLRSRRRRTAAALRAATSGAGEMPSYGSASHAGSNATSSGRNASRSSTRASASCGPGATASTGASSATASPATTNASPVSARAWIGRSCASRRPSKVSDPTNRSRASRRLTSTPDVHRATRTAPVASRRGIQTNGTGGRPVCSATPSARGPQRIGPGHAPRR